MGTESPIRPSADGQHPEFFAAFEQFTASGDASGHDRFFASPFMSASADGAD
jgi:hypothetical protein